MKVYESNVDMLIFDKVRGYQTLRLSECCYCICIYGNTVHMLHYCIYILDFSKTAAWNVLILHMHVAKVDLYQVCERDDDAIIFLFLWIFKFIFLKNLKFPCLKNYLANCFDIAHRVTWGQLVLILATRWCCNFSQFFFIWIFVC